MELRVTASIWPFWRRVAGSTVEFSGSRLRKAPLTPSGSADPKMGELRGARQLPAERQRSRAG